MKQYINNLSHSFSSMFLSLVMWREKHVKERTFVMILCFFSQEYCADSQP